MTPATLRDEVLVLEVGGTVARICPTDDVTFHGLALDEAMDAACFFGKRFITVRITPDPLPRALGLYSLTVYAAPAALADRNLARLLPPLAHAARSSSRSVAGWHLYYGPYGAE